MKLIFGLHAQSPFEASSLLSESLGIYGYFINNKSVLLLATGPPNATTHNLHEADETYHRFQRSSRLFQTMLLSFSVKVLWFWLGTIPFKRVKVGLISERFSFFCFLKQMRRITILNFSTKCEEWRIVIWHNFRKWTK